VLYSICLVLGVEPHVILARAEERLRAEAARQPAPVTPLRRRHDVPGPQHNGAEVAFDSPVRHRDDTDDLYDD
jgi:hypothetical protein